MIGTNIYKIRRGKGITLSELAKKAGMSKSNLSNIERNININPSINLIERIAESLDVELYEIIQLEKPIIEPAPLFEDEWVEFIQDLKDSGIKKEDLPEYKRLIEFIHWQNQQDKK
ncbi:helix-turn-helix domain-containing protein [Halobacillus sp. A1]|uniref:helix-turn-helix domain-containing protein n=1 Tax=Halobacillus sp. A1 TaxID=2880262 RepID=UPI0020A6B85D|nr:helix-turn-helix transcriptional regulator [Halobacillus sp. A1]MCP3030050.1 helix-turn-helix domain-containing protein [Halobacillus sp. A1]